MTTVQERWRRFRRGWAQFLDDLAEMGALDFDEDGDAGLVPIPVEGPIWRGPSQK